MDYSRMRWGGVNLIRQKVTCSLTPCLKFIYDIDLMAA
jgi:hypothetical protein